MARTLIGNESKYIPRNFSNAPNEIANSLDGLNVTEQSLFEKEQALIQINEECKRLTRSIAEKRATILLIKEKNGKSLQQLSEEKKKKEENILMESLDLEYELKTLDKKLTFIQQRQNLVNHEYNEVSSTYDNFEFHYEQLERSKNGSPNAQSRSQSNAAATAFQKEIINVKKQTQELDKTIKERVNLINTLKDTETAIERNKEAVAKTQDFLMKQINSSKSQYGQAEDKMKQQIGSMHKSKPKQLQDKEMIKIEIKTQMDMNNAVQQEIDHISSQYTFLKQRIDALNSQLETKSRLIYEKNSEAKAEAYKAKLLQNRVIPSQEPFMDSFTKSKQSLARQLIQQHKNIAFQQQEAHDLETKIDQTNAQIIEEDNVRTQLEKIDKKLDRKDKELQMKNDPKKIRAIEKELKKTQKQIQILNNEYEDIKNSSISSITNSWKKSKSSSFLSNTTEIAEIQNENEARASELSQKLSELKETNNSLQEDCSHYSRKADKFESKLQYIARRLYLTIKQTPERVSYETTNTTLLEQEIEKLENSIEEQKILNKSKKNNISRKRDSLYQQATEIGHYDPLRDVCVVLDPTFSPDHSTSKTTSTDSEDNDTNSETDDYKEIDTDYIIKMAHMKQFTTTINKNIELISSRTINWKKYFEQWLDVLYKHQTELQN